MRSPLSRILLCLLAVPAQAEDMLHVIDVGYGACVHLESGEEHYLFDTGSKESSSKVLHHLAERGVTRLSAVFLTHAHPDHAGALPFLVSQIPIDKVFWNGQTPSEKEMAAAMKNLERQGDVEVLDAGARRRLGAKIRLEILPNTLPREKLDLNDGSLVFLLTKGKSHVLLPGDIQTSRQKNLAALEKGLPAGIDWMLWPHHGDTLAPEFLNALGKVRICVLSVGENHYGLPGPEFASQAGKLCGGVIRTDQKGDVSFPWAPRSVLPASDEE